MEEVDLKALLLLALGPAASVVVKHSTDWASDWLRDHGKPLSAVNKRDLAILMSILVPSALYGLGLALGYWQFSAEHWIVSILAAFGLSQVLHRNELSRQAKPVGVSEVPTVPQDLPYEVIHEPSEGLGNMDNQ